MKQTPIAADQVISIEADVPQITFNFTVKSLASGRARDLMRLLAAVPYPG